MNGILPNSRPPQVQPSFKRVWGWSIFLWLVGWPFGRLVGWSVGQLVVCNAGLTSGLLWFSTILNSQYTSDPQYFYRLWKPYTIATRGSAERFPPTPLTLPIWGQKYFFGAGGFISDGPFWPPKSQLFLDTPDLKHYFGYPWGVPLPPWPLDP